MLNIRTCCRLCLDLKCSYKYECSEIKELNAILLDLFNINIKVSDRCTTKICRACFRKVMDFKSFKNSVIFNQSTIKETYNLNEKIILSYDIKDENLIDLTNLEINPKEESTDVDIHSTSITLNISNNNKKEALTANRNEKKDSAKVISPKIGQTALNKNLDISLKPEIKKCSKKSLTRQGNRKISDACRNESSRSSSDNTTSESSTNPTNRFIISSSTSSSSDMVITESATTFESSTGSFTNVDIPSSKVSSTSVVALPESFDEIESDSTSKNNDIIVSGFDIRMTKISMNTIKDVKLSDRDFEIIFGFAPQKKITEGKRKLPETSENVEIKKKCRESGTNVISTSILTTSPSENISVFSEPIDLTNKNPVIKLHMKNLCSKVPLTFGVHKEISCSDVLIEKINSELKSRPPKTNEINFVEHLKSSENELYTITKASNIAIVTPIGQEVINTNNNIGIEERVILVPTTDNNLVQNSTIVPTIFYPPSEYFPRVSYNIPVHIIPKNPVGPLTNNPSVSSQTGPMIQIPSSKMTLNEHLQLLDPKQNSIKVLSPSELNGKIIKELYCRCHNSNVIHRICRYTFEMINGLLKIKLFDHNREEIDYHTITDLEKRSLKLCFEQNNLPGKFQSIDPNSQMHPITLALLNLVYSNNIPFLKQNNTQINMQNNMQNNIQYNIQNHMQNKMQNNMQNKMQNNIQYNIQNNMQIHNKNLC